jgi:hypothetical protein
MQMVTGAADTDAASPARRQEALQLAAEAASGLGALRRVLAGMTLDDIDRAQLRGLAEAALATSQLLTGAPPTAGGQRRLIPATFVVDAVNASSPTSAASKTLQELATRLLAAAEGSVDDVTPDAVAFAEQLVASARRRASSSWETIIRS